VLFSLDAISAAGLQRRIIMLETRESMIAASERQGAETIATVALPLEPLALGDAQGRDQRWHPAFWSFVIAYACFFVIAWVAWEHRTWLSPIDWYASVVWTLPVFVSAIGLAGGLRTRRRMRAARPSPSSVSEMLIVVVPTIGRPDTFPALERVVGSYCRELPRYFRRMRVDIVVEEDCEQREEIDALASLHRLVRVVVVPRGYETVNGTRFKARANNFADGLRRDEGEVRDDVWVLHMDDDTAVGADTARELAAFVERQRRAGVGALHLGQGVLCFPREHAHNPLVWLADAVRPGCDIALFAATTGRGRPRAGLHGELLLVRASVEGAIGWDFGPRSIVEDAAFAMVFCERYPGRSGWISGRSYGASPATVTDYVRQRERWMWGLLELATSASVPLRRRLLILHNVGVWSCAAIAHPVLVLLVAALLGDGGATPVSGVLVPLWALNMGFCIWLYWEGFKLNVISSAQPRFAWWEPLSLVALMPLFSIWETVAIARAIMRLVRRAAPAFAVISKPY
jgi:beta-1,4-mannosyltransferase